MLFVVEHAEALQLGHGRTIRILFDQVSHKELPAAMLHGVRPAGSDGEGHRHAVETELFIALEGEGVLTVDGVEFVLRPGCVGCALPGTFHTLHTRSEASFSYYALFVPGMNLDSIRAQKRQGSAE